MAEGELDRAGLDAEALGDLIGEASARGIKLMGDAPEPRDAQHDAGRIDSGEFGEVHLDEGKPVADDGVGGGFHRNEGALGGPVFGFLLGKELAASRGDRAAAEVQRGIEVREGGAVDDVSPDLEILFPPSGLLAVHGKAGLVSGLAGDLEDAVVVDAERVGKGLHDGTGVAVGFLEVTHRFDEFLAQPGIVGFVAAPALAREILVAEGVAREGAAAPRNLADLIVGEGAPADVDVVLVKENGEGIAEVLEHAESEGVGRLPAVVDRDHDTLGGDVGLALFPVEELAQADDGKLGVADRLHLAAEILDIEDHVVRRGPVGEVVVAEDGDARLLVHDRFHFHRGGRRRDVLGGNGFAGGEFLVGLPVEGLFHLIEVGGRFLAGSEEEDGSKSGEADRKVAGSGDHAGRQRSREYRPDPA